MELTETTGKEIQVASDDSKTDITEGECKEWCSNDTQCVAAMYQMTQASSTCFIYKHKINVATESGSTVFEKENITSSGMYNM